MEVKGTLAVNVLLPRRKSLATAAVRLDISRAIARARNLVVKVAAHGADRLVAGTLAAVAVAVAVDKSATNVGKLAILHGTAPKLADTVAAAAAVAAPAVGTVVAAVDMAASVNRHVTLAAGSGTWLAIALKGKSATTVSCFLSFKGSSQLTRSGGEVGHLSRDCPSEASGERVCYKCKQPGHVQASCPN